MAAADARRKGGGAPATGAVATTGAQSKRRGRTNIVWDSNCYNDARLPTYNSLHDQNLRTHYEKRTVRQQLFSGGSIDRTGRILGTNSTKLNIIMQEFHNAEKNELLRMRDEEYEKKKLNARKQYMRQQMGKIERYQGFREQQLQRRQQYANKYFSFLPTTGIPTAATATTVAGRAVGPATSSSAGGRTGGRERTGSSRAASAAASSSRNPTNPTKAGTVAPSGDGKAPSDSGRQGATKSDSEERSSTSSPHRHDGANSDDDAASDVSPSASPHKSVSAKSGTDDDDDYNDDFD